MRVDSKMILCLSMRIHRVCIVRSRVKHTVHVDVVKVCKRSLVEHVLGLAMPHGSSANSRVVVRLGTQAELAGKAIAVPVLGAAALGRTWTVTERSDLEHFSTGRDSNLTASAVASPTAASLAAVPMFVLIKRGSISYTAVDVCWKWRGLIEKNFIAWGGCWGNECVALPAGVGILHGSWGRELCANEGVFSNRPKIR